MKLDQKRLKLDEFVVNCEIISIAKPQESRIGKNPKYAQGQSKNIRNETEFDPKKF